MNKFLFVAAMVAALGLAGCVEKVETQTNAVTAEPTLVAAPASQVDEQPTTFDAVRALAMAGDYQAQRNLAYGYSSSPYPGQDKNAMLACAWRIVIIQSGNEKVDETDVSNHKVYCDSLGKIERAAAEAHAAQLLKKLSAPAKRIS